jgi:hypothetical protein
MNLSKAALTMLGVSLTSTSRCCSAFTVAPSAVGRQVAPKNSQGLFLFDKLFSTSSGQLPVRAEESVMSPKAHGTSEKPVQKNLRWNCDYQTADRICNFNRHYAEVSAVPLS